MTDGYIPPADLERAQRKASERAEFMRAVCIAAIHSGAELDQRGGHEETVATMARHARLLWDAIEAEAAK